MNSKPIVENQVLQTHPESSGSSEKVRLQGHLTTPFIIILIMGVVSPISAVAALLPLGFGFGTGAGLPGTILIATIIMLFFSAGYAAMSRQVKETGAFYAYITKGLGRLAGGAGAFIALLNYIVAFVSLAGGFGYFAWSFFSQAGLNLPWWVYALISIVIIYLLCNRNIDVSVKVLTVLLAVTMSLLIVFVIATLFRSGIHFPASSFSPGTMFSGGWGGFSIGLMYCLFLFSGVELAAVYAEESKNPERTVGRSTYGAVLVIGIFYVVVTWCMVAVVGPNIQNVALNQLGQFSFDVIGQVLGKNVVTLITVFVLISYLSAMVGFHQATARYMVAMGRDKLLPQSLAYVDPVHKSPRQANLIAALCYTILLMLFAIAKSDPFATLISSLSGLCMLCTISLWVMVSLAFIVYFRRHKDRRWMTTFVMPSVALVALSVILVLIFKNYTMVTGSTVAWINHLPWILLPVIIIGIWRMLYLRSKSPEVYALIWQDETDDSNQAGIFQTS